MAGRVHPAILERVAASDPKYPWRKRKKAAPRDPSVQLELPGGIPPGKGRVR